MTRFPVRLAFAASLVLAAALAGVLVLAGERPDGVRGPGSGCAVSGWSMREGTRLGCSA
jgi:hypothetical protein